MINANLKTQILDWGISDAVLSLGTMKVLLRRTVFMPASWLPGLGPTDSASAIVAGE